MNTAQADIVFLRYTYTWYLLPNTAEMCCQNWLYRTCGTSLPRSATTLRRNSSSVTGKTTMCICLSIIRPKYPSLSWSTVSRVYPVAVCEAFALKLRVGIAKVSFGRRLILPLHVVVRRSILSANMSKRSEPTKNRASAVAPYIPALKDEVLRRVPIRISRRPTHLFSVTQQSFPARYFAFPIFVLIVTGGYRKHRCWVEPITREV